MIEKNKKERERHKKKDSPRDGQPGGVEFHRPGEMGAVLHRDPATPLRVSPLAG